MIVTPLSLRPGEPDDLPELTALYNHYVVHTHVTFDTATFSVEQRRTWFSHYSTKGRHRLFVATVGDELVGYATSSKFRDKPAYETSVEATVYVRESGVRSGVGSALYTALFDALGSEDVHRAYAGIALPNDASMALHRRFGFTDVGTYREVGRKFDRYWDVSWFEKTF